MQRTQPRPANTDQNNSSNFKVSVLSVAPAEFVAL